MVNKTIENVAKKGPRFALTRVVFQGPVTSLASAVADAVGEVGRLLCQSRVAPGAIRSGTRWEGLPRVKAILQFVEERRPRFFITQCWNYGWPSFRRLLRKSNSARTAFRYVEDDRRDRGMRVSDLERSRVLDRVTHSNRVLVRNRSARRTCFPVCYAMRLFLANASTASGS